MGSYSDETGVLTQKGNLETETYTQGNAMGRRGGYLQAEEHQRLSANHKKLEERNRIDSSSLDINPDNTYISDFKTPEKKEDRFLFSYPIFGTLLPQPFEINTMLFSTPHTHTHHHTQN